MQATGLHKTADQKATLCIRVMEGRPPLLLSIREQKHRRGLQWQGGGFPAYHTVLLTSPATALQRPPPPVFAKCLLGLMGVKTEPCNFVLQTRDAVGTTTFCWGLPTAGTPWLSELLHNHEVGGSPRATGTRLRDRGAGSVVYDQTRHQSHT